MPMTREERLELLKLAREAKAKKKLERDSDGGDKPVVKRSRKPKLSSDIEPMEAVVEDPVVEEVAEPIESEPEIVEPVKKPRAARSKKAPKEPVRSLELNNNIDVEDDVMVEEIVEVRKKPKKKVIKKIIYESCSEDEVEEVVVENKPKKVSAAKVKKIAKPVPLEAPKEVEVKPSFSFFNC